jgi:hypothetical protein
MRILLAIHIVSAGMALVSGAVALCATKGARLHRRSGMLFVYAVAAMCATAIVMALVKGQTMNVIAGLMTAYLVITALTTVRPPSAWSQRMNVGLMMAALVLGLTTLTFGFEALASATGTRDGLPPFPFFMFGVVGLLGSVGDFRMMRSGSLRGVRRLTRHLWRMCWALWIATASFFLPPGRVAKIIPEQYIIPALLPLPVLLVLLTMLYFLWRVRFRRKFRAIERFDVPASSSARI